MEFQTRALAKLLMIGGGIALLAGGLLFFSSSIPFLKNFGHLPGDFVVKTGSARIYFPLMSSILLSVVVSVLMWLFRK